MILAIYRSTECYKICGRIGIFALPLCICLANWCHLVGGTAYGPALVKAITLFPAIIALAFVFIFLTLFGYVETKEKPILTLWGWGIRKPQLTAVNAAEPQKTRKTNLFADIGYVMYILFMLFGIFILFI